MAVLRRQYERARKLARQVLWECGVDEPSKIDPLVVAGRRRIDVVIGRLDGATAQILRHGERAIIRVSDQIVQLGRLRFTVAHELGHFLLGHRIPDDLDASAQFARHLEREADVFATEFLMPEAWVSPMCDVATSFEGIDAIAETFRTSTVASAVRFVELAAMPCAVVYSEAGYVAWAKRSRSFPSRIPAQLEIGSGTIAFDHHHDIPIDTFVREVPARAWLGSLSPHPIDGMLVESGKSIPEPGWGGFLSLLALRPQSDL